MYDGCTYKEVEAMRDLDQEPFTLMTTFKCDEIEWGNSSEYAYYEMFLEPYYYYWNYYIEENETESEDSFIDPLSHKKNTKGYLSELNYKSKILNKMGNDDWLYGISYSFFKQTDENGKLYIKRNYRGGRSTFLKKQYHRKMRNNKLYPYPKGNGCRKTFDFWWEYD